MQGKRVAAQLTVWKWDSAGTKLKCSVLWK